MSRSQITGPESYPFSVEARRAAAELAHDLRDLMTLLSQKENEYVIEEAERRVLAALEQRPIPLVNTGEPTDFLIYPTARIIVEKIGLPQLKEYQAEAESKAVNERLGRESITFVMRLCGSAFGWKTRQIDSEHRRADRGLYDLEMRYSNFLEVAPTLHDSSWKLVNRPVSHGWVKVRLSELNRLISGKFKHLILQSSMEIPPIPDRLALAIQRIESEAREKIRVREPWRVTTTTLSALPPCISQMYLDATSGRSLPHEARFTLASFLLRIGMNENDVTNVFRASSDFVRSLAEYQVRHISGKDAGKGYSPPACKKLQTSDSCPVYTGATFDPLCEYVRHPLSFYRVRAWEISRQITDHSWYVQRLRRRQTLTRL